MTPIRPPRAVRTLGLLVLFPAAACAGDGPAGDARPDDAAPDPARFAEAMEPFAATDAREPPEPGGVVFVGSSSIGGWPLEASFPSLPVLNRGFGGSHLSDVVHHAPRVVLAYAPRAVVVYAGDNDVHDGVAPDRVVENFAGLVDTIHERLPGTDVVFLSIKPSPSRRSSWPTMVEVNARIRARAGSDPHLHYVDVASSMIGPDGEPRPELFADDGLHLSAAGYALWSEALRPVLDRILRD